MALPHDLIERVRAAYPDRKLSVDPWLAMWDPTGKLWYITPFEQDDEQVLYSEDGQCMARRDVENVCGHLHDATAEQLRRREVLRAGKTVDEGLDHLFRRLGPPTAGRDDEK